MHTGQCQGGESLSGFLRVGLSLVFMAIVSSYALLCVRLAMLYVGYVILPIQHPRGQPPYLSEVQLGTFEFALFELMERSRLREAKARNIWRA